MSQFDNFIHQSISVGVRPAVCSHVLEAYTYDDLDAAVDYAIESGFGDDKYIGYLAFSKLYSIQLEEATEGFRGEFKDVIKMYNDKIHMCMQEIPIAIQNGDAGAIRYQCDEVLKICEDFRLALKELPEAKFNLLSNAMPYITTVLLIIVTIAKFLGPSFFAKTPGTKKIFNSINSVLADSVITLTDENPMVGAAAAATVRGAKSFVKSFGIFGTVKEKNGVQKRSSFGIISASIDAAFGVFKIAKKIKEIISNINFGSMIREEDKTDKNAKNNKFRTALGQIEFTITNVKEIAEHADQLIAENRKRLTV